MPGDDGEAEPVLPPRTSPAGRATLELAAAGQRRLRP